MSAEPKRRITMATDLIKHTCCFTGHRPEKLSVPESAVRARLAEEIGNAVEKGYLSFISGMARGFDIWAAEEVLALKAKNPAIRLICAVPHPGFEKNRSIPEKAEYKRLISAADRVFTVSDRYFSWCYQVRNRWMVNRSSLVIAGYSGIPSGTRNTILYAEENFVPVINVLE